jgi:hypothetical protein
VIQHLEEDKPSGWFANFAYTMLAIIGGLVLCLILWPWMKIEDVRDKYMELKG